MKKELTRIESKIYHYQDGKKVDGAPAGVRGDLSGVQGDLDECDIAEKDRAKGIYINDLIK